MCVLERRVYFSLLFLPPSLHVSLISHPSIFHFYMQLQMWRQWNIKLQKWACFCTLALSKTTQPLLSSDPTHFLTLWKSHFKLCVTIVQLKNKAHLNCVLLNECTGHFFVVFLRTYVSDLVVCSDMRVSLLMDTHTVSESSSDNNSWIFEPKCLEVHSL